MDEKLFKEIKLKIMVYQILSSFAFIIFIQVKIGIKEGYFMYTCCGMLGEMLVNNYFVKILVLNGLCFYTWCICTAKL